jgi:hypothetical protein
MTFPALGVDRRPTRADDAPMRKLLAFALSSALLAACADGPGPVNRAQPKDAVLDAIVAVYEAGTFHQTLEMSMSAAGQSFEISGEADVDHENQRIDMTMDLGMLGGTMRLVIDEGVIYMRSPMFPNVDTEWVSMDPAKVDPAIAARFGGGFGAGTTDPSAFLGLYAGVFDVEESGTQELDGVPTTRYAGSIDLGTVLDRLPDVAGEDLDGAAREQLEMALQQFRSLGIEEKIPFEIWIDDEGLPRRQRITMDFGDAVPGTEDASMDMVVDYSDVGKPVDIRVPRPSEVTDVTEMIAGAASAGSGSGSAGYA